MADINQVISLGIGSPAGIPEFLTFGLQIGEQVALFALSANVKIRETAATAVQVRQTATSEAVIRSSNASGDTEL